MKARNAWLRASTQARGVTLVELLIVLAIVGSLALAVTPSLQNVMDRMAVRSAAHDFLATLHHARAAALARQARVVVTPLDGVDWSSGWMTFVDSNLNNRHDLGEAVLIRQLALRAGIAATSRQSGGEAMPFIAYAANGYTRAGRWNWLSGTVTFRQGDEARAIVVNALGRARLTDAAPASPPVAPATSTDRSRAS
ncbi:MAG: GspH/FimT family pseudopilin [Burkholderiales bacterium]|nr:GspH/FimT family pseudopilin [Burkholderiales bacterium]MDE2287115.1 GspH/FimT family pseudopilin [Burkholderiales bacterium]MDE2610095.1 GspH/FimT family pseudopilin [Burkholderiales bacterium]